MASKQVVFKASVEAGKEIRKFTFPDSSAVDYAELRSKLATLFSLACFRIRYKNSQGNLIVIGNEKEMRQALADILSCSAFEKVIIRLVLDQTTAIADNEPRNVNKAEERPAALNPKGDDEGASARNAGSPALERVLNAGLRGFQDMVETLVNQLSTNTERDLVHDPAIVDSRSPRNDADSANTRQPVPNRSSTSGVNVPTSSGTSLAREPANVNIKSPRNDADTANARQPAPNTSSASGANVPTSNGTSISANVNIKIPRSDADTRLPVPKTSSICGGNVPTSNRNCSAPPTTTRQEAPREPIVHYNVICDCCERVIEGMRWKCRTCADYDLCNACKPKVDVHKHNSSHAFEAIQFPAARIPRMSGMSTSHNAVCDYCDAVIAGIRYKCIHCPDFDLCNSCIDIAPSEHPNHTFMPIHRPGEPEIRIPDAQHHPGIRCDGCTKLINGVRYKCGNCPDFDLCGNCEASPFYNHDLDHVLIKIKRPIVNQMVGRERAALLPNFYTRADLRTQRPKSFVQQPEQKPSVQEVASQTNHEAIESLAPVATEAIASLTHVATQEAKEEPRSEPVTTPTASVVSQSRSSAEEERPASRAPIALYESNPLDREIVQSSPKLEANPITVETVQSSPKLEANPITVETVQSSPELDTEPEKAETSQSLPTDAELDAKLAAKLDNLIETQIHSPELEPMPIADSVDILPLLSTSLKAECIEDVNIPPNTSLAAQAQFLKAWKMRNNGTFAWPKTTVLKYVGGEGSTYMFDESLTKAGDDSGPEFPVGVVQPGESVEVTADLQAPAEPGTYTSYWRLNDGEGHVIGRRVWCQIVVQAADETSSLASSSVIFPRMTQTVSSSVPTSIYQSDIDGLNADAPAPFREAGPLAVTAALENQPISESVPTPTSETEEFDSDSDSDLDSFEIIDEEESDENENP